MNKTIIPIILAFILIASVSALDINVQKKSSGEVMILGLDKPAVFNLSITNHGPADNLMFYTFFSPSTYPKGTVSLGVGETKNVQLEIYPPEKIKTGYYTFDYFIKGQDSSEISQKLTVNVITLSDAFEIGSGEVDTNSNSINIYIQNKVNTNFDNVNAEFTSPFFDLKKTFSLGPYEKKEFTIELNKDDFKKLLAGYYTMNADIDVNNVKTNVEGIIKFNEKDQLVTTKKDYGLIINTQIITKTNEGNVLETSETIIKKNTLSRLFTTFTPEPTSVDKQGMKYYYTWKNQINPGDKVEITVRTNWIFPIILLALIIAIAVLTKLTSERNIVLRKRVSFIRAKGGEFALKVSVFVHAKRYIEKVNIIERLPPLVKLHERFGVETPTRINEKAKRIEWNFDKLEAGETRTLNYIIYSKIGVLGKFALPRTMAVYEKDGKVKEDSSNKTFFIAEQIKELED